MSIILRIDNNSTFIEGKLNSPTYKALKRTLGYIPEDAIFRMRNIKQKKGWTWDGYVTTICYDERHCKCPIKKQGTHFPTGLVSNVLAFLKKENIAYKIYDIRKKVDKNTSLEMSDNFEERDYQREVVDECLKRERGVVKMSTGSGKTASSALLIKELGVSPFIFYVPSIDLLKQAQDELQKMLTQNGKPLEVGIIGGGYCDIKDINVMTIQTAVRACGQEYIKYDDEEALKEDPASILESNRKDVLDLIMSSKGMICDECITGDTLIHTEKGKVRIDKVDALSCKKVLSYNGKLTVWRNIEQFLPRGKKKTVKIEFESGRILRCTYDHPLMTRTGWKETRKLQLGDEAVTLANETLDRIIGIKEGSEVEVYDINVEETHCFFANDILVHNCQHWEASTCQIISDYSVSARYKFGVSATPARDKGDDILIDACFGRVIKEINASYLIESGYLVQPNIYFIPVKAGRTQGHTYQSIYSKNIVENIVRNNYISNIAQKLYMNGDSILILVRIIKHGNMLKEIIPNSVFIHGSHSAKHRKKHLDLIRSGQPSITIASVILDEGIDVRPLNTLILAGSGKSQTRALQRIGRTLRPYTYDDGKKKTHATIIDFEDHYKYMLAHSRRRKKMYQTEPKFNIEYLEI